MPVPRGFKIADFGYEIGDLVFKQVKITWSKPRLWKTDEDAPIQDAERGLGHIYAIVRDHHRAKTRENIAYIGISQRLDRRFGNHPKAEKLKSMRGQTALSIGNIEFGKWTHKKSVGQSINDIEHILIWAIGPAFNERKWYSLPGFGKNGSCAWHITNAGHRFAGRMPREIAYPWMITKPGRDRSSKGG
ncbi:hypothetical protein [Methylocapsa aurea]|uniref:hypothetical protein n=1 Tax=Methylocapsa aurea TaxID=663610 RepID=UPI003D187771